MLTAPELAAAQRVAQQRLAPATAFVDVVDAAAAGDSAAARYAALDSVAVATADTLPRLRGLLPEGVIARLRERARDRVRFVYAWPRNGWSRVYVVVGPDAAAAGATLLQLVALRERRFSGEWLPPPLPGSVPD